MTNPSREPEKRKSQKPIRFILPREVCTDPETTAKLLWEEFQRALKTLRDESDSTPDVPRVEEG